MNCQFCNYEFEGVKLGFYGCPNCEGEPMNPTPDEIKAARQQVGLTQTQAGALLHTTCRTWQQWEAGDRAMHAAFWELFQIKTAVSVNARRRTKTEISPPLKGGIEN